MRADGPAATNALVGHGSFQAWPRRVRDRLRWLARRWTFALAGFALGLAWVAWLQTDAINTLFDQQEQVEILHEKLATLQAEALQIPANGSELQGPPKGLTWLPAQDHQALIWLQLSRLLGQHTVELRSLRPVPERVVAPVASQAIAIRLHANFDDWVSFWADLNARGPVWSIDRLRITPQGKGVDIEAVLRVWLRDDLTRPSSDVIAAVWPGTDLLVSSARQMVNVSGQRAMASEVFVRQPNPMDAARLALVDRSQRRSKGWVPSLALGESNVVSGSGIRELLVAPPSLSSDPRQWPLQQVRLLGVWQQPQGALVILAAGPHWLSAHVGQPIGPHGHRVVSIHEHEVHLRDSTGGVRVLGFEKATP